MNQPAAPVFRRLALTFLVGFAAVLLQAQSCERGDTFLLSLEFEVDGQNLIQGFNINNRSGYIVTTESTTATLSVQTRAADSTATYEWQVDGTPIEVGAIGVGGGTVIVNVPVGLSRLFVAVRAVEGAVDRYIVDVQGSVCVGAQDGQVCALANGAAGWCIEQTCQISTLCPAGKCADANPCTDDSCDPSDGTCSFVPSPGFRACQAGGANGVCFDDACVTEEPDCLSVGYGRVNCCAACDAFASTCEQLLPEGSECDPTGREAPDQTRSQAGHCSALGECLWDAGHPDAGLCLDPQVGQPCFTDTENADVTLDAKDCTARWCDPAVGCTGGNLSGTYPCEGNPGGTCLGSDCQRVDCCASAGEYTPCCPNSACGCTAFGVCELDVWEGNPCVSLSGVEGICSLTPLTGGSFSARCVATACAFEDPNSPGDYLEIDCDDGIECTEDACDPDTGECVNTARPALTPCNGGDGVCLGDGTCADVPEPCDVSDPSCYPCTLQGLLEATAAGGGTHRFSCSGPTVINLDGTLDVVNDVALDGGGQLTIEGNGSDLMFRIAPGVAAELRAMTVSRGVASAGGPGGIINEGTLTLADVTVTECESVGSFGGPVHNEGTLTVLRSVFSNNTGNNGSGALTNTGTLKVFDSFFFGNITTSQISQGFSQGGALWSSGNATLTNTTVDGNDATFGGGGIYNTGFLELTSSTVSNNTASLGPGGGVWSSGPVTLAGSDIDDNVAVDRGGGVYSSGPGFDMVGGSVSGNIVSDPGVDTGFGGGLAAEGTDLTLTNVRLANNQALGDDARGGGISVSASGSLSLVDTMLIGNNAVGVRADGGGVFFDGGASPLSMTRTTLFGNFAGRRGGGLSLLGDSGTIVDGVVASNVAGTDGGGFRSSMLSLDLLRTTVSGNRSGERGGGLASLGGSLTLIDSDVSANDAVDVGGGIVATGDVQLERTTVGTNISGLGGGGIFVANTADVAVTDASVVSQNVATGSGGGIRVFRGTLVVSDSNVDGNSTENVGGGIASVRDGSSAPVVTILRSTVSSNVAAVFGGGVESRGSGNMLTIEDTAIFSNDADVGAGGGVYVHEGASAVITNTTIAKNFAATSGDGLRVMDGNTDVDLVHVTFSENGIGSSGEAVAVGAGDVTAQNTLFVRNTCDTAITSLGGNIEAGNNTCGLSAGTGDALVPPGTLNLSQLGLNGGPTVNYLPGPGSTAIDVSPCIVDVATEQRGINARPQGGACDCGAVEAP